jgi:hypothetical protein
MQRAWQDIVQHYNPKTLTVGEDHFMGLLLNSLPASWTDFIHPFMGKRYPGGGKDPETYDVRSDLTLNDLVGSLIQEAHRRKTTNAQKRQALLAVNTSGDAPSLQSRIGDQVSGQKSDKRCTNCKRRGHVKADCWFLTQKCEKCGKMGHQTEHCRGGQSTSSSGTSPNKRRNNNPQSGSSGSKKSRTEEQAHAVIEEVPEVTKEDSAKNVDLEFCVDYGDDDNADTISFYDWLADTCTTSHICNSRDAYESYHDLSNAKVRGVGNVTANVLGRGTVRLRSRMDDKSYTLILQNVLHVPMSQYSLLSLGKWDKSCGNFTVDRGCLSLARRDGKVVA